MQSAGTVMLSGANQGSRPFLHDAACTDKATATRNEPEEEHWRVAWINVRTPVLIQEPSVGGTDRGHAPCLRTSAPTDDESDLRARTARPEPVLPARTRSNGRHMTACDCTRRPRVSAG